MKAYHPDAEFPVIGNWQQATTQELLDALNHSRPFVIEGVLEDFDGENTGHETFWAYRSEGSNKIEYIESASIAFDQAMMSPYESTRYDFENYFGYVTEEGVLFLYYITA